MGQGRPAKRRGVRSGMQVCVRVCRGRGSTKAASSGLTSRFWSCSLHIRMPAHCHNYTHVPPPCPALPGPRPHPLANQPSNSLP